MNTTTITGPGIDEQQTGVVTPTEFMRRAAKIEPPYQNDTPDITISTPEKYMPQTTYGPRRERDDWKQPRPAGQ